MKAQNNYNWHKKPVMLQPEHHKPPQVPSAEATQIAQKNRYEHIFIGKYQFNHSSH